jgi:hypothetical protein
MGRAGEYITSGLKHAAIAGGADVAKLGLGVARFLEPTGTTAETPFVRGLERVATLKPGEEGYGTWGAALGGPGMEGLEWMAGVGELKAVGALAKIAKTAPWLFPLIEDHSKAASVLANAIIGGMQAATRAEAEQRPLGQKAVATGLGAATGAVGEIGAQKLEPVVEALPAALGRTARRIYERILKPGPGTYSQAERQAISQTGLETGTKITEAGLEKLRAGIDKIGNEVLSRIRAGDEAGWTIDPYGVAQRTTPTAVKFAEQVNPNADLDAVMQARKEWLQRSGEIEPDIEAGITGQRAQPIPVEEAQRLKTGTYRQLRGKYGQLGPAQIEAQKALARGIKEELEGLFPGIKELNAEESRRIDLDGALERAVNRIGNREWLGLRGAIFAGAGLAAGSAVGGWEGAFKGAALGLMWRLMENPEIQSTLAIALHRGSKIPLAAAARTVTQYTEGLAGSLAARAGRRLLPPAPAMPTPGMGGAASGSAPQQVVEGSVAIGPQGHRIRFQGGRWLDAATGQPFQ